MGGELFDIEERQAMRGEDLLHGAEGEIGEMLVVNRIELVFRHQAQQMRELQGDHAVGLQQEFEPAHEIVQLGHVGQDIVPHDEVGLQTFGAQATRRVCSEEFDARRDALLDGGLGHICGGFDAQHRDAFGDEILQQVAVIAGDFYDLTLRVQSETLDRHLDIELSVAQPGIGV